MKPRGRREDGALAIVLHAHMPYVEGFGTWPFGEEWLFEAIATVYVPLIESLERLAERDVAGAVNLDLTPVLCDQLSAPGMADRCLKYMRDTKSDCLVRDLETDAASEAAVGQALKQRAGGYFAAADLYESWGCDLLGRFAALAGAGRLRLWTSAATHPILPLLATQEWAGLQVRAGVESHRRRFGEWGGGFWLPECAYGIGVAETVARESGLAKGGTVVFCHDPGVAGEGRRFEVSAEERLRATGPVLTSSGAVAASLDWETIDLVWGARGYPSNPEYRSYSMQSETAQKPYRNDGRPYCGPEARLRVAADARAFLSHVKGRLDMSRNVVGSPGLIVCAVDAELLGHWWADGVGWLECVVSEASNAGVNLVGLPDGLDGVAAHERPLADTSWGAHRDLSTWDSPDRAEWVWRTRRAEIELVRLLGRISTTDGLAVSTARELMALQASDWAFLETRRWAAEYPAERVMGHLSNVERGLEALRVRESTSMSSSDSNSESDFSRASRNMVPGLDLRGLSMSGSGIGTRSFPRASPGGSGR